MNFFGGIK